MRLSARNGGTSLSEIRWASPSTMAVLPTPGSPISTGLFLVRRHRIWMTRSSSRSRPTSGSSWPSRAACVRSRLNSASREVSFGTRGRSFFTGAAGQFLAQRRQAQPALLQDLRAKALFFAQDSQQQVLGSDVAVPQALRLFRGEIQDALGFLAERHFHGRGDALANGDALLDLLADGLDRAVRTQETIGQRLVLAHQAEQQVLSLDVRGTVLAGFVARKEYDASGLLCVTFKHGSTRFSLSTRHRGFGSTSQPAGAFPCSNSQHAIRASRQNRIMRGQDGGELMVAMQPLHQLENAHRVPLIQISGGFIRQQQSRLSGRARGRSPRAVAPLRTTPRPAVLTALPIPLPGASVPRFRAPRRTWRHASAAASPRFRPP